MVATFKYNGLYFAIAIIIAIVSVYESYLWLSALLILMAWLYYKRSTKQLMLAVFLTTIVCLLYVSWTQNNQPFDDTNVHHATIISEPKINGASMRGFLKTEEGQRLYFAYSFTSEQEKALFEERSLAGLRVLVKGEMEQDIPAHRYAFDMKHYLKSKNALGTYSIESLKVVGESKSILYSIAKQRFKVKQHIAATFPDALAAEAQALLIGVQDEVDEDMQRAYQKLGITHLFAISGLHVALISFMFYEVLLRCRIRVEIASLALLIILPLYALFAGGTPSVWRAVAVVLIIALTKLFKWRITIDDALSYSCVLFLLIAPHILYQVGFQLSYLATLSLILSSSILNQKTNIFGQNFYMTLVCQLITYPILLYHFYELSLSSFIANIIFVPLFSFIIVPLNVLLLLLSYSLPQLSSLLFILYEPCRQLLANFLIWLKDIPYQMWIPGKPSFWWIVLLYISVGFAFLFLEKRTRLGLVLSVLLIPAMMFSLRHVTDDSFKISYLNVGQGDSILIELPRRKEVYLVDTGGLLRFRSETWKERDNPYEVGRQVVVPYLKGKGIAQIDKLILTHADADHVEGAEEVLREIAVREIHVTPNSVLDNSMTDLLKEATKRKIPIKEKMAGINWQIKATIFAYLSPTDLEYEGNNDSLVLYIENGKFRTLITGDLEVQGELQLIENYGEMLKDLTILKAGHHGSKTSSEERFIDITNPTLTIFTAGKNNRYNHPASEVVERFTSRNLNYVITGIDGTIEVTVNHNKVYYNIWAKEYAEKKKATSH